ncbi:MAG: homocysteine S-methyltransferase family protein, partial [Pseudomonadota bacterium]
MNLKELDGKPIILDGGMGQELVARSTKELTALWATMILLQEPELVESVHKDYFDVGADVATTNTYATHRDRLKVFDLEDKFEQLMVAGCEIACRARDKHGSGTIAGSLGPNARSYRPDLVLGIDEGAEIYAEIARIQAPFVDVLLLETMVSLDQATGALMGAASVNKPVWLSVSVSDED